MQHHVLMKRLCLLSIICLSSGLHEEVDYSEKLKFSDDEEDRLPCEKKKIW